MENYMKKISLLAATLFVSACATPREQCISDVSSNYDALVSAISKAEQNIARGYAIHRQTVPYTYSKTCQKGNKTYPCPETRYRTEETPVMINISEERSKLIAMKRRKSKERVLAQKGILQCQAVYPE